MQLVMNNLENIAIEREEDACIGIFLIIWETQDFGTQAQKTANLLKVSGKNFKGGRGDSNVSSPCKDMKKHVITGCF